MGDALAQGERSQIPVNRWIEQQDTSPISLPYSKKKEPWVPSSKTQTSGEWLEAQQAKRQKATQNARGNPPMIVAQKSPNVEGVWKTGNVVVWYKETAPGSYGMTPLENADYDKYPMRALRRDEKGNEVVIPIDRHSTNLLTTLKVGDKLQYLVPKDQNAEKDKKDQPMPYGDKLSKALQMVPSLLEGDAKALFHQLTTDPKFVAALVGAGVVFAALQATPIGPALDAAFLVAFGLKAGIEIGQFFYEAYQAKDAKDPRLKAAAEKLKSAIEDGGAAMISGLAGGFKTLGGLLNKLKGGNLAVRTVQALGNLSNDAQEAIRLLNLGEKEISKVAELVQKSPEAADGLLRQMLYKIRKAGRKGTTYERPQDVAKSLEESLKNYKAVTQRGYPFGFRNLKQFQKFKGTLGSALKRYKIPTKDIRIQGSAVHKTNPGDLDVAIVVGEAEFKALGKRFFDFSEKTNVRKSITKELENGKIPSYRFAPGNKPGIGESVYGEAGELNIQVSLIKRGSEFDVGPYLNIGK
jgi:hypothetical protein